MTEDRIWDVLNKAKWEINDETIKRLLNEYKSAPDKKSAPDQKTKAEIEEELRVRQKEKLHWFYTGHKTFLIFLYFILFVCLSDV